MPERRNVVVAVDDAHMSSIHEVAERLRSAGLDVTEVMEAIGLIAGTSAEPLSTLQEVPGVASVEEPPSFQLPPPDSPVQ